MLRKLFLYFLLFVQQLQAPPIPTLEELSLDEKIGQILVMATVSSSGRNQEFIKKMPYILDPAYTGKIIQEHTIGGVIFLGAGSPEEQVKETERLQAISTYPLLVGLDAEWGLAMRHEKHVVHFPRAMVLGAIAPEDDHLIYELGQEIGRQCKELGVHINFAPVVDVNNNPRNPIINTRSFGENPDKVSKKASLFIKGMQAAGILACAKHFPGHGDTEVDTHHGRGVIHHDQGRLHAIELVPFQQAIADGVDAVMTAHLDVPAFSQDEHVPATLSHNVITSLLRQGLKFNGLIITDALGMKGVTDVFEPGELELKALKAGNDILLCPVDVPGAIARIKKAIEDGELTEKDLNEHVERILQAKRTVISHKRSACDVTQLITPQVQSLKEKLYRAAVTMIHTGDDPPKLPLSKDKKVVVKTFGDAREFVKALKKEMEIDHFPSNLAASNDDVLSEQSFNDADQIIVSLHLEGRSGMIEMQDAEQATTPPSYVSFIMKYAKKVILALFGNPYNLTYFPDVPTVVVGYENEPEAQRAVAQTLLGSHTATGILPVTPLQ